MRTYFYDRPNPSAPPLGYPDDGALVEIPENWTVWALGDVHGILTGLVDVLIRARLVNTEGRWIGGGRVALVGLGDYIDRGWDSRGVITFLRRLAENMASSDSRLVLVRGNHEQMLADILRGSSEWFETWVSNGGHAFASSYGLAAATRPLATFRETILRQDPELLTWLLRTLPYARWRDVLFVHGGLPRDCDLAGLLESDAQLWDSDGFVAGVGIALDPDLVRLRDAGIGRVVVGHAPQLSGPRIDHYGCTLLLDTVTPDGGGCLSIARMPIGGALDHADLVLAEIAAATDRPRL
jgi:serine/threonine protein phosphatase 1